MSATTQDFKVKDYSLAEWGRKEITGVNDSDSVVGLPWFDETGRLRVTIRGRAGASGATRAVKGRSKKITRSSACAIM